MVTAGADTLVDAVATAPTILDAIHATARHSSERPGCSPGRPATRESTRGSEGFVTALLHRIADPQDRVTAIAATHALAQVPGAHVATRFFPRAPRGVARRCRHPCGVDLVSTPPPLDAGAPSSTGHAGGLDGHLAGMHAQAALAGLGPGRRPAIIAAAPPSRDGIARTDLPTGRSQLIETLGLIPDLGASSPTWPAMRPRSGRRRSRYASRRSPPLATGPWEPIARQVSALSSWAAGPVAGLPGSWRVAIEWRSGGAIALD